MDIKSEQSEWRGKNKRQLQKQVWDSKNLLRWSSSPPVFQTFWQPAYSVWESPPHTPILILWDYNFLWFTLLFVIYWAVSTQCVYNSHKILKTIRYTETRLNSAAQPVCIFQDSGSSCIVKQLPQKEGTWKTGWGGTWWETALKEEGGFKQARGGSTKASERETEQSI